jgi:cobalt-zinc-cadmium efflux system protein
LRLHLETQQHDGRGTDHGDDHGHSHGVDNGRSHGDDHGLAHRHGGFSANSHSDRHGDGLGHSHGDAHARNQGDDHGHSHGGDHGHSHGDDHGRNHGDDHGRNHGDDHGRNHGDDHGRSRGDDHGDGHSHGGFGAHSHGDGHGHEATAGGSRALILALLLTGGFALVEFAGGLWSGSLALLADAGHMVTDAAALGLSLAAHIVAQRPVSARHSYGLARSEVIAAFVNSLALLAVVVWLVIESVDRIAHPVPVNGRAVAVIAAAGCAVNLLAAWVLSHDHDNLNIRAALLHVISDLMGSVAALIAGVVIITTGYTVVDPLLSMLVSGLILRSTFGVLRETTLVLLNSVPAGVDYESVGRALASIPGVKSVHDLHIWAMVPGKRAASAHLMIERIERWPGILLQGRQILARDHGIGHVTLQPECFVVAPRSTTIPIHPTEK